MTAAIQLITPSKPIGQIGSIPCFNGTLLAP